MEKKLKELKEQIELLRLEVQELRDSLKDEFKSVKRKIKGTNPLGIRG